MALKILVVDDEQKILNLIRAYLEDQGYRVLLADDGEQAITLFDQKQPDIVILDLMLPVISGEEVCRYMREVSDVPILMLTAKTSEDHRVAGLELGADDYITKPFSPRELVARVKAIARRAKLEASIVATADRAIQVDVEQNRIWVNENEITLTPTELKILLTFLRNPGKVFSRSDLAELIFGLEYEGYEDSIYVHIKNLRHKIEPYTHQKYISTVYGMGYRWEDTYER